MIKRDFSYQVLGKLEIPYKYYAGEFSSKFLTALRDDKKILGVKCPKCKKVFIPPRSSCEKCFVQIKEWVELSPIGELRSFCVINYEEPYLPLKPPFVLGLIRLQGADSDLVHIVNADPSKLKIGLKLKAVFKEQRKASILDITYFEPL